jgi:hypothetical protein
VRESRTPGSARGVISNEHSYRNIVHRISWTESGAKKNGKTGWRETNPNYKKAIACSSSTPE